MSTQTNPLQYPFGIRQPVRNDPESNYKCLMDLWTASTQPYQYISYTPSNPAGQTVFTIKTKVNLLTIFADGVFLHPGVDYTVSNNVITTTNPVTAKLSIIGM